MTDAPENGQEAPPFRRRKNWKKSPKKDDEGRRAFEPRSPAMVRWNDRYNRSKKDGRALFTPRSQQPEGGASTTTELGSFPHSTFCGVLMGLALVGGFLLQMGLTIGPDGCDNVNAFEQFGGVAFFLSMIGVPINGLIVLISLTDKNMDTGKAFAWTVAHLGVLFFTIFLFQDGVFQDMFC